VVATVLMAAIFVARLLVSDPTEPITFLMVVPIGLLAASFGLRGGVGGAFLASLLIFIWDEIANPVLTPFGYGARFVIFFLTGTTVGLLTSSRARLEEESSRWFDMSADLNCVADFDGKFLRINPAWAESLGYSSQDLLSAPYMSFVHPDDVDKTTALAAKLVDGQEKSLDFENRYRKPDGSYVWLRWTSRTDHSRRLIYASARDISVTKVLEEHLRELAQTDSLTGLFNRRHFEEEAIRQLDYIRRYGSRGALFAMDIDRFKEINDSLGHAAGDEALVLLARVIRDRIRATDLAARVGGDEFIILFPEVGANEAQLLGQALLNELERTPLAGGTQLTISVGIALFSARDDLSLEMLSAAADRAMYQAKRAGGNQFAVLDASPTP
jgi:diguanylate cyclase (GGDEF)-like protein/PAS domain S-box-containing protein